MNIPKTMKALVAYEPNKNKLEEVPVPKPKKDEILIKVEACGVCAGDIKAYHGAVRFWGENGKNQYTEPPFIPGHEFLGFIVAMGDDISGFKIGDRVISEQIVPCGECKFCTTGRHWMCQRHDVYGFRGRVNGGMAQYAILPIGSINYLVPKEIPIEAAVLIEPYACAKHAVDRGNIGQEDVVVLAGAGTLGLGMVGYIRKKNPAKLIVLDMKDDRLQLAKDFGADLVFNPSKVDVVAEIMRITDDYGCDVYIEASGHHSGVQQGLDLLRKMGRFVEFSVFSRPATVDWSIISDSKELDVLGAHLSPYCYEPVIKWIADGSMPTKGVVTNTFSLEDWEKAFAIAEAGQNTIKVMLVP